MTGHDQPAAQTPSRAVEILEHEIAYLQTEIERCQANVNKHENERDKAISNIHFWRHEIVSLAVRFRPLSIG